MPSDVYKILKSQRIMAIGWIFKDSRRKQFFLKKTKTHISYIVSQNEYDEAAMCETFGSVRTGRI